MVAVLSVRPLFPRREDDSVGFLKRRVKGPSMPAIEFQSGTPIAVASSDVPNS
jgi:hypothetical protein